jgi:methionyl-tRNA formyltransferase
VRRLTAEGHDVVGIVAERTDSVASIREWLWKLGPRVFVGKAIKKGLRRFGVKSGPVSSKRSSDNQNSIVVNPKMYRVASHNSPETVEIVRSLRPDVIILRGCGIIRKPILDIPKVGTINPHYALLPAYRGMDVTEWSALHGDPVSVSVHIVNEGVDTGSVLVSRSVDVEPGDTLGELRDKSAALAVDLIADALNLVVDGVAFAKDADEGRQYYVMHPRLRNLANARLKRLS